MGGVHSVLITAGWELYQDERIMTTLEQRVLYRLPLKRLNSD